MNRATEFSDPLRQHLLHALDHAETGYALFGPSAKLVYRNAAFMRAFTPLDNLLSPGTDFSEFATGIETRGGFRPEPGEADRSLKSFFGNSDRPNDEHLTIFCPRCEVWLRLSEEQFDDGSRMLAVLDITASKRDEERLRESETRYELAVQQAGIWDWDLVSNEVVYSPRLAALLGYEEREFLEVIGDSIRSLVHPDDEEEYLERLNRHLEHPNESYDSEHRFRAKSGDYRWVRARGQSVCDENGRPVRMTGIITDIDARKTAERELADNRRRLQSFAEAASDWFWEMDENLRFTYMSDRVFEAVGVPVDFHIGKTRPEMAGEKVTSEKWKHHLQDLENRRPFKDFQYARMGPDGRIQHLSTSGKPVFDENGTFRGYIGVGRDLTARIHFEEAARIAKERLVSAVEALADIFALWDADDRLIVCNEKFREVNLAVRETTEPGTPYEDHIRATVAADLVPQAKGREEEWIEERLARHREPGEPFELERQNGRIFLITEQRFPNGSTATISADITAVKQAEEALKESEERFRLLVEGVDIIGWELSLDTWCFTYVAPQAEELFGYSMEEWRRKGFWADHFHPDDREEAVDFCVSSTERGEDHEFEYRFMAKDGRVVWLRDIVSVVKKNGKPVGLRGFMVDISQIKRVEAALAESRERFEGFARVSSDFFWEMDEKLRFSKFSERFTEITGVPTEDLLGKTREQTGIPHVDPQAWEKHLDDLANHQPFRNFVHPRQHPDGRPVWLSISGSPIFDEVGGFSGYRGTGSDVTEIKVAEENLRRAKEESEFANRTKTEFLANMSHELRTPLNSILGFSETMMLQLMGEMPERYNEYSELINHAAAHLLGVINDLLDVSKIEFGSLAIEEEVIDPGALLANCVVLLDDFARKNDVIVTIQPAATRLPKLLADARRVKQIVLNLLGNAIKFSRGGTVTLSADLAGGGIRVHIEDTGVGIADDDIPKVMEAFAQVRASHEHAHGGAGLGLHLTKRLAEIHEGRLSIASELGVGTRVTVQFPPERTLTD